MIQRDGHCEGQTLKWPTTSTVATVGAMEKLRKKSEKNPRRSMINLAGQLWVSEFSV